MYLHHCPYTNAPSTVAHGYLTLMPYHSHLHGVLLSQTHLRFVWISLILLKTENTVTK